MPPLGVSKPPAEQDSADPYFALSDPNSALWASIRPKAPQRVSDALAESVSTRSLLPLGARLMRGFPRTFQSAEQARHWLRAGFMVSLGGLALISVLALGSWVRGHLGDEVSAESQTRALSAPRVGALELDAEEDARDEAEGAPSPAPPSDREAGEPALALAELAATPVGVLPNAADSDGADEQSDALVDAAPERPGKRPQASKSRAARKADRLAQRKARAKARSAARAAKQKTSARADKTKAGSARPAASTNDLFGLQRAREKASTAPASAAR